MTRWICTLAVAGALCAGCSADSGGGTSGGSDDAGGGDGGSSGGRDSGTPPTDGGMTGPGDSGASTPSDGGSSSGDAEADGAIQNPPPDGGIVGDSCDFPIKLSLGGDGTASTTASSVGARHDHDGPSSCAGNCDDEIDMVFSVDIPGGTVAQAHYRTDATDTTDCITLEQDACAIDGFSITCGVSGDMTNPSEGLEFEEAGTAYLFVWNGAEKEFEVEITTESL